MLPPPDSDQLDAPLFVPDASGFFGIRLESIGGYGANVAGRILAEAGFDRGWNEVTFHDVATIVQAADDSCFFPLYEVELGKTRITYDPEAKGKKIPVDKRLGSMGKTRHMLKPANAELLADFQAEVDRRWRRLKAMDAHSDL